MFLSEQMNVTTGVWELIALPCAILSASTCGWRCQWFLWVWVLPLLIPDRALLDLTVSDQRLYPHTLHDKPVLPSCHAVHNIRKVQNPWTQLRWNCTTLCDHVCCAAAAVLSAFLHLQAWCQP
jgi:hypothetical protein